MHGVVPFPGGRTAEHGVGWKRECAQQQHQREHDPEQDTFHKAQHHDAHQGHQGAGQAAVSYTHLTLPTKRIV